MMNFKIKSFDVARPLLTILALVLLGSSLASAGTMFGAYYGNQGFNMQQVRDMEAWQGKRTGTILLFHSWCSTQMDNLFKTQLPAIWANGNVPVITWEPYLCTVSSTPGDIESRAANGAYDTYFKTWADRLKVWLAGPDGIYATSDDRRVYIRLGHEMNGNWYPWSGNPTAFVTMWRRIRSIFETKNLDITHVQFMWVPNAGDVGSYKAEQYWPGVAYVDWVGVDGYNFGIIYNKWTTPAQRFDGMIARIRALAGTKPIVLAESGTTASTLTGVSMSAKNSWIQSLYSYAVYKGVKQVIYFNRDTSNGSHDWAIFGGVKGDSTYYISGRSYKVYTGYRTAVRSTSITTTDRTNPRLLTDMQFLGQQ